MQHELIGKEFPVLDKGFIKVIALWGDDHFVCEMARNTLGKGTRAVSDDRQLLRYMMRHAHTSPFEFNEIVLQIKMPMDAWRQQIRHRTANVSEYSTRYSEAIDDKQTTKHTEWRLQSQSNRQGSGDFLDRAFGDALSEGELWLHNWCNDIYQQRLKQGVAREQARKDLPLSTYTLAMWKIDLHNLLHYLKLRMHPHAQLEIRSYATIIGEEIVAKWCPLVWEAFRDYVLDATTLSSLDSLMLGSIISAERRGTKEWITAGDSLGWLSITDSPSCNEYDICKSREREEFEVKMQKMGIEIPWKKE